MKKLKFFEKSLKFAKKWCISEITTNTQKYEKILIMSIQKQSKALCYNSTLLFIYFCLYGKLNYKNLEFLRRDLTWQRSACLVMN